MEILVQKFGGTSLANEENREKVAEKIIKKHREGYKMVIVVSAIGRKENPYSTDSLISLIDKRNIKKRELDLLMSCGEIISAAVLSSLLNSKNMKNTVLTGSQAGIVTNDTFTNAKVLQVNPNAIVNKLKEDNIVIVTGFQGITKDGNVTTLGRGGSDTTAVLLGEAMGCKCIEIYTDVNGIMTADPRVVPDAKLLEKLSYKDVYQLAENGAKVIHPRAVEVAERSNLNLVIKNTLKDSKGTIINNKKNDNLAEPRGKIINAITCKNNKSQIIIYRNKRNPSIEKLMDKLSKNNISIDLINLLWDKIIFTIDSDDLETIEEILKNNYDKFKITNNCSKISIIGHRMKGRPGVMNKIVKSLCKENIDILQTSDSHTTIWCLIKEKNATKAIRSLHKEFQLNEK
ncbi:aspartate kinase [Dethiothermospora halolimnae]|uniref:aspartate kinase n=1 Tax=Dethiothermospora halolimnae TaxID=3114390 RepID=UPI003CCBF6C0